MTDTHTRVHEYNHDEFIIVNGPYLDNLAVRRKDNALFWNGQRVRTEVELSRNQLIGALAIGVPTAIAAVATAWLYGIYIAEHYGIVQAGKPRQMVCTFAAPADEQTGNEAPVLATCANIAD